MTDVFKIIAIALVVYFTHWMKETIPGEKTFMYYMTAIVIFTLSSGWMDDYPGPTVALWGFASLHLLLGIWMVFATEKASRGWSQFRTLFHKIKGGG